MARHVNFGLWYDFRNPAEWRQPFGRMYQQYLDQIVGSEALGFDSVWLTEHHFCDDGYTPSPLVIAAAIGARTTRLRIGTNLMILPLHDPKRIAEDAATLSLLTGGRFDLGVGIGYKQSEFEAFGRELKQRPSLIEEAIEIIRRAWRGEEINFQGKRFAVGKHPITPAPEIPPRIFLGGMSEAAIDRAARVADGFLSTGGIGQDLYLAALEKAGKQAGEGAVMAGHWAIICDDPEAEAQRVGPHILYQANEYIKWGAFGPPESTPLFADEESAIRDGLYEIWDVETAVEKLDSLIKAYPQIQDIHFWAQFPGEPIEQGQKRIELIAESVLPRLRLSTPLRFQASVAE
jgi:alkanesulfonate monooxygenase SsuD/methylene tetrahydromethanopterin reductase-like flavin-dependent oxidoreductase (luciferase family)